MDKLTDTTYDGIVAALPKLGTQPEHVKTYFDMLDTWRTAGTKLEDNLLGDTEIEQAKNYNKLHKRFSDWFEKNPDATLEQTDAAFQKLVSGQIIRDKILGRAKLLRVLTTLSPLTGLATIGKRRELAMKIKELDRDPLMKPEAKYKVGDTIDKNGRKWIVTGFDEDGTPLVEEKSK